MSVCPDIAHQGKPSGSNASSERTSYTHATLKYLSNQKHALFQVKMEMYVGDLDKFRHQSGELVRPMNFGSFFVQN